MVFSNKKNKSISPVILFLLSLVTLTVFVVGAFVIILFKGLDIHTKQVVEKYNFTTSTISYLLTKENYQEDLRNLFVTIEKSSQNGEHLVSLAQEALLDMKVPQDSLEKHMQSFLDLEDLKRGVADLSLEELHVRLAEILEQLVN